jgi:hypothetical protein
VSKKDFRAAAADSLRDSGVHTASPDQEPDLFFLRRLTNTHLFVCGEKSDLTTKGDSVQDAFETARNPDESE